jgi:hypothetical protein
MKLVQLIKSWLILRMKESLIFVTDLKTSLIKIFISIFVSIHSSSKPVLTTLTNSRKRLFFFTNWKTNHLAFVWYAWNWSERMIEERNMNDLSHFFCLAELRKSKERLNKAGVHIVLLLPYIAKKEERKPFFCHHFLLCPHFILLSKTHFVGPTLFYPFFCKGIIVF